MSGEGEFENSPEVTPTWVIAGSAVIIVISYAVLQIIYGLRNFVSKHNNPICSALQDVTKVLVKELPLLGLISLFLKLSGNLLTKICVPPSLFHHDMLLPCSPADRCQAEAERQANAHPTSFCYSKSKVPLLSAEAVQQIHIFIILLGTVYFILSFIIFHFGSVTIHCWQKYNTGKSKRDYQNAMKKKLVHSHNDRFLPLKILCQSFFKQFIIGVVTESDYMEIAVGLCMDHDGDAITEELKKFHKDISSSHEKNFWQIVGIRWYLWVFVVFFLLLNVHGWHVSFWIAFAAFIALIITITGTILELILAWLALKIYENYAREIGPLDLLIQRSDKPLWFPPPSLVLHLIRFILFQNAFQIAIFLWIGITFGFDSCMMGQLYYHVTKLIIGGCTLGLCGYSTLPLYTIVTELENAFNKRLMILSKEE